MCYREKTAWAYLVTTLVVFLPYFVTVFSYLLQGGGNVGYVLGWFIGATVITTLLAIIYGIVIEVSTRHQPTDERDLLIDAKSNKFAYYVLSVLCFCAMGCVLFIPLLASQLPKTPFVLLVFVSQVFFLCFCIAEVVKYSTQVVCYRRGS